MLSSNQAKKYLVNQPQNTRKEVFRMKQLTNYRRAVQYLQKIYNLVNEQYFNNELEVIHCLPLTARA